ncbi:hypothetical protein [Fusobacterium varium]|nr:hypothetical protein [Fusobacterium varium]MCF2674275.1 hypothetical protein [Fusobacterium varium]
MKNDILRIKNEINHCTSCQLYSAVCLADVIKIKVNREGFYQPINK